MLDECSEAPLQNPYLLLTRRRGIDELNAYQRKLQFRMIIFCKMCKSSAFWCVRDIGGDCDSGGGPALLAIDCLEAHLPNLGN